MKKKIHLLKIKDKNVDPSVLRNIFDSINEYLNDDDSEPFKILGHEIEIETLEVEKGDVFYVTSEDVELMSENEYLIRETLE